jgi:hypothetical protein
VTWLAFGASTTVTATGIVSPVYLPVGAVRAVVTGGTPSGVYAGLQAVLN